MKPLSKHLKLIALLLSVTVLLQSCKSYSYKPTTINAAVNAPQYETVKIKTDNKESYLFIKLLRENGELYGLAEKQSKTAKKLSEQTALISKYGYDYVKILLNEEQINKVYMRELVEAKSNPLNLLFFLGIVVVAMIGGVILAWVF